MTQRTRILIVDDHAGARAGVRAVLETEEGFEVVGEAAGGREAYSQFEALHPDVTVLDVRLWRGSGFDVLNEIRRRHPEAAVLMMSAYERSEDVALARSLGAKACVLKDLPDDLIAAIRALRHSEAVEVPASGVLQAAGASRVGLMEARGEKR